MGKASAYIRRNFALDKKLREKLFGVSTLVDASKEPSIPATASGSQSKPCLALGLCICTKHTDVGFFCLNFTLYCRKVFWNKKKENKCSLSRSLLDSFLIVLEFKQAHTSVSLGPSPEELDNGNEGDWDSVFQAQQAVTVRTSSLFLHIGRVDLRNWHFGALTLQEVPVTPGQGDPENQVKFLRPHVGNQQHGIYSDTEAFAHLLTLSDACSLMLHQISMKPNDWLEAPDGCIAVHPVEDMKEFMVWQGSRAEEERRRALQQSKNRTRKRQPRTKPSAKSKRQPLKKRKMVSGPKPLGDGDSGDGSPDENDIGEDPTELSLDEMLAASGNAVKVSDDGSEEEQNQDHDDVESLLNLFGELPDAQSDLSYSPSLALDHDQSEEEIPGQPEVPKQEPLDQSENKEPALEVPEQQPEIEGREPLQPSQQPEIEAQPSVLPPPAPPEDAPRSVDRPVGISRSTANRDVMDIPPYGELHFYHLTDNMVAFCGKRTGEHADGCRKQATTNPKSRGSGRPIGYLVWWLMQSSKFKNRLAHVHCASAPWQERKNARDFFESLPGSDRFASYERKKKAREDAEPKTV